MPRILQPAPYVSVVWCLIKYRHSFALSFTFPKPSWLGSGNGGKWPLPVLNYYWSITVERLRRQCSKCRSSRLQGPGIECGSWCIRAVTAMFGSSGCCIIILSLNTVIFNSWLKHLSSHIVGQPVYLLLISVSVLCYQPSHQNCLHINISFWFVAVRILPFHRKQTIISGQQTPLI